MIEHTHTLWPPSRVKPLTTQDKSVVVNSFVAGKSTAELCTQFASHRSTIEQVLREAIHYLASFVNEDAQKLAALTPPSNEGTPPV
jgi:hypothetical protein